MTVTVGIHEDPLGQFCTFLRRYEEILSFNGISTIRLNSSKSGFWNQVPKLDLFIYRWGHNDIYRDHALALLPVLQMGYGLKCFPDIATSWHYDDKIRQDLLLKAKNYPFVESYLFWDRKEAETWALKAPLPVVFKLRGGASSRGVLLVTDRAQLRGLIKQAFTTGFPPGGLTEKGGLGTTILGRMKQKAYMAKSLIAQQKLPFQYLVSDWIQHKHYAYFQKFLPNNRFDTRITVIGERAFGFRRFNRPNDFRASGSGRIDHRPEKVDPECVELAHRISREMGFQSMAYDFIYDDEAGIELCEISYTYQDVAVFRCPGYWDRDLKWHTGHFWPQYSQLLHLLEMPDLIQPPDLFFLDTQ